MIPAAFITEWSLQCPWTSPAQVEQDLVLSRALVNIYSHPGLCERLLFRGGTALHKIVLRPAARYSEDLDFVQLHEEPIGPTLDLLRARLNPWLGEPKCDIGPRGATLLYRFESELPPVIRLRLKVEINTREHLCLLPSERARFTVASRWFSGEAHLPVYATTELLGTKLRALYQRRKGRDLFDLWQAHQAGVFDARAVAGIFTRYMHAENLQVTGAEFSANLDAKLKHPGFQSDTPPLLRPGVHFDPIEARAWLAGSVIPHLP